MTQPSALLRLPEVQKLSGLSRSSIYRLEATGSFPARVKLSQRATAWRESDISAWIATRQPAVSRTTNVAAA
jgi:prophage regulatory protein